jgi:hypothetical protein
MPTNETGRTEEPRPEPAEPAPEAEARPELSEPEEGARVSLLLAVAAALAAAIGGWSSIVGDAGSDTWHRAVREQVKQTAGAVEDIRFVYDEEANLALQVAHARLLEEELRQEATESEGLATRLLEVEADAQQELGDSLDQASELAGDPRYENPDGSYDLLRRLADNRAKFPELIALDPDATEDEGSRLNLRSTLLTLATVPVAVAFLCGALVYGFRGRRRLLVTLGWAFVAVGLVAALVAGIAV